MLIDMTRTVTAKMPVFPGDSPIMLKQSVGKEDNIVHFHITMGMHVGTHMDGPLHMIPKGKKISDIAVDKFVANGHVIDARGSREIGAELLENHIISLGDCVLIYTGFDEKFGEQSYYTEYPCMTESFARKLVELKIKFVGMDTPSPDRAPYLVHRMLLQEEILIIEGLTNLSKLLDVKWFEITALPAKFEAEASPARVIAKI